MRCSRHVKHAAKLKRYTVMRKSELLLEKFQKDWLQGPVSSEDLDAEDESLRPLLEALARGHEAWRYRTPKQTWERRRGRAGYVVVVDAKPAKVFVTMMN